MRLTHEYGCVLLGQRQLRWPVQQKYQNKRVVRLSKFCHPPHRGLGLYFVLQRCALRVPKLRIELIRRYQCPVKELMYPDRYSGIEIPETLNKYLVKCKGTLVLQNSTCTVQHSLIRPFWSSLHSLHPEIVRSMTPQCRKKRLTTFTMSNGWPTST